MFNPWLVSTHPFAQAITDNVCMHFQYRTRAHGERTRRMKDQDKDNLRRTIQGIVANLVYAATNLEAPTIGVRLGKRKRTRYEAAPGMAALARILGELNAHGLFCLRKSNRKGHASSLEIAPGFLSQVRQFKFRPQHFGETSEHREVVALSRVERDYIEGTQTRELVDYKDTEETARYRSEVKRINECLSRANLHVCDAGAFVPTNLRSLYRRFNLPPGLTAPRFDLGGRLFGGWWQRLEKGRRGAIRINGEPIVDLDFQSMFLRLAYVEAGARPPNGDLYAIVPGFTEARWRPVVKKVAAAMLFRTSPLVRLPRDLRAGLSAAGLPLTTRGSTIRAAILKAHPALTDTFEMGIGLRLMFTESQILVAALLHLIDRGIPALPMHDGIMVAQSKKGDAIAAMRTAALAVTGANCLPIVSKPLKREISE